MEFKGDNKFKEYRNDHSKTSDPLYFKEKVESAVNEDRYKRETIMRLYSDEVRRSLKKIADSKNQLKSDVEIIVESLNQRKEDIQRKIAQFEKIRLIILENKKESERLKCAENFKLNHEKIENERKKTIEFLEKEKEKSLKEINEWFESNFSNLNPNNQPYIYGRNIVKSNNSIFQNNYTLEDIFNKFEYELDEKIDALYKIKIEKEERVKAEYERRIKSMEEKFDIFRKHFVQKEIEVLRHLNNEYDERIADEKKRFVHLLSVQINKLDQLVLKIKSKQESVLLDLKKEEAKLKNDYVNKIGILLDPKQEVPLSFVFKYSYLSPMQNETKLETPTTVKTEEVKEQKVQPEVKMQSELNLQSGARTDEKSKVEKPINRGWRWRVKVALYYIALGSLIYFYPDLQRKELPDSIRSISNIYVQSKTDPVVISSEKMKKISELKLSQLKTKSMQDDIQKSLTNNVKHVTLLPNSPLLSVNQSTDFIISKQDQIRKNLIKSGIIFDIDEFMHQQKLVDMRFTEERDKFALKIAELNNKRSGFLGLKQSDHSLGNSILTMLNSESVDRGKKKQLTTVLSSLNERQIDRKMLKTTYLKVKKILNSQNVDNDFSELSFSPSLIDSSIYNETTKQHVVSQTVVETKNKETEVKSEVKSEVKNEIDVNISTVQNFETKQTESNKQIKIIKPTKSTKLPVSNEVSVSTFSFENVEASVNDISENINENITNSDSQESVSTIGESASTTDAVNSDTKKSDPPRKVASILLCGDKVIYVQHDENIIPMDNDPNICENFSSE